jgi:hypothetical protein
MPKVESPSASEVAADDVSRDREVSVFRYPGREPVIVRTVKLQGDEPSREERIRARLHRVALEGRITLPA